MLCVCVCVCVCVFLCDSVECADSVPVTLIPSVKFTLYISIYACV
jgi:hypothetical protein